jgi:hypothetical protein
MNTPQFLQGESLTRLLQGIALGAVATMIVGFNWGGWMMGSTAAKMADISAKSAVVAAIAPICVQQFQMSADAATNMAEMKKTTTPYQQAAFIEKGGWAMMPGSTTVSSGVSEACAKLLNDVK